MNELLLYLDKHEWASGLIAGIGATLIGSLLTLLYTYLLDNKKAKDAKINELEKEYYSYWKPFEKMCRAHLINIRHASYGVNPQHAYQAMVKLRDEISHILFTYPDVWSKNLSKKEDVVRGFNMLNDYLDMFLEKCVEAISPSRDKTPTIDSDGFIQMVQMIKPKHSNICEIWKDGTK
jgi:hypothetical protein